MRVSQRGGPCALPTLPSVRIFVQFVFICSLKFAITQAENQTG